MNNDEMCTTKWYKQHHLEFNVFSAEDFSKAIFLMDHSYSNIIQDGFYKCFFFQYGTNKRLKGELLNRIGGSKVLDTHGHTFCLECSIPIEARHPNAKKIHFILATENNFTNVVDLSICRSYESSFNFINSRIHLENQTKLNLENKIEINQSNSIGACTQTSHHDLEFPLWINYHYKMGIDHFYIYDHAPSNQTNLHKTLRSYIDLNLITIIPWYVDQWIGTKHYSSSSTSNWITHQIWSQNDCIHRYGHLHSWILLSDVDEYVLPMGQFHNFNELLNIIPPNYCALQILHYSFNSFPNNITIPVEDRPKKFVYRQVRYLFYNARSKNFVRPKLIYYFSVHQVTQAANSTPIFYADVNKHARLQHYQGYIKSPQELSNYIVDTRILSYMNQINNSISSIISN